MNHISTHIDPLVIPQWLIDLLNSPIQAMVLIALVRIDRYGMAPAPGDDTILLDKQQVITVLGIDKSTDTIRRAVLELAAKQVVTLGTAEIDGKNRDTLTIHYPEIASGLRFSGEGGDYRGGRGLASKTSSSSSSSTGTRSTRTQEKEKEKKEKEVTRERTWASPFLTAKPEWNIPEFIAAWESWAKYRQESGKPLTPTAARLALNKLGKYSVSVGIAAIHRSIDSGWRGLFPESIAEKDITPLQSGEPKRTAGGGFLPPIKK
jgi:hypothetical protein